MLFFSKASFSLTPPLSEQPVQDGAIGVRLYLVPLSVLLEYNNSLAYLPPSEQPVQDGKAVPVVDHGGEHLADKSTESMSVLIQ